MLRGVGRRIHSEWQVALLLVVTRDVALQVVMESVAEHLELESLAVGVLAEGGPEAVAAALRARYPRLYASGM